jgi:hypothetical protein
LVGRRSGSTPHHIGVDEGRKRLNAPNKQHGRAGDTRKRLEMHVRSRTPFTTAAASRGGAEGPLVLPHRKAWSSPMRLNSPPRGPHPTTTVVLPRPAEGRPSRQGAAVGLVQNAFAGDTTLCFLLWLVYVYTNRSFFTYAQKMVLLTFRFVRKRNIFRNHNLF